jgi:hypothetical protein
MEHQEREIFILISTYKWKFSNLDKEKINMIND